MPLTGASAHQRGGDVNRFISSLWRVALALAKMLRTVLIVTPRRSLISAGVRSTSTRVRPNSPPGCAAHLPHHRKVLPPSHVIAAEWSADRAAFQMRAAPKDPPLPPVRSPVPAGRQRRLDHMEQPASSEKSEGALAQAAMRLVRQSSPVRHGSRRLPARRRRAGRPPPAGRRSHGRSTPPPHSGSPTIGCTAALHAEDAAHTRVKDAPPHRGKEVHRLDGKSSRSAAA